MIYDYHGSNPDNVIKHLQQENTELKETTIDMDNSGTKEEETLKPKEISRKSGNN